MNKRQREVRIHTLSKAADIVGGPEPLGRRLNVSSLLLAVWLNGVEAPPTDVFLRAVDIVQDAVTRNFDR